MAVSLEAIPAGNGRHIHWNFEEKLINKGFFVWAGNGRSSYLSNAEGTRERYWGFESLLRAGIGTPTEGSHRRGTQRRGAPIGRKAHIKGELPQERPPPQSSKVPAMQPLNCCSTQEGGSRGEPSQLLPPPTV